MIEDRAYTILTALRNIKLSISDEMNEQLKPWFEDIEKAIEEEQREKRMTREYREYAKSRIECLLKISRLDERDKEALEAAIQALSQEPCQVKNELNIELNELKPCDDAINREDAIRKLRADTLFVCTGDKMQAISDIESLPPVTPSCDKCAMNGSGSKYCDNCGQKSGKCELKTLIDKHRMYRLAYDELSEFERDVLELAESEDKE